MTERAVKIPKKKVKAWENLSHADLAIELAFAAGLLVGEGHISTEKRKHPYLILAIAMYDRKAVTRFARTAALSVPERTRWKSLEGCVSVTFPTYNDNVIARVHLGGRSAEGVARALYPYMHGTDKAKQTIAAFKRAGLPHPRHPFVERPTRKNPTHKIGPEELSRLRFLSERGTLLNVIAQELGVTEGAVRYWLRKEG